MSISELAGALGVRPSALRHWEAEGLLEPDRCSPRRIRRYLPSHVRDARIVHQLRTAGQRIDTLKATMPALRAGNHQQSLDQALNTRQAVITRRSQALLEAATHLHPVLG
jgi:DNA-binding transcriptional MerR regulator